MKVDQAIIKNFCVSGWKCSRYYTVSYYLSLYHYLAYQYLQLLFTYSW